jgi:RNA-directed DNA polymerase
MLCDEDCRTAGFGKTERPVGWEGNGETSCKTNEALHLGNLAVTDRLLLPMPNHSFTLDLVVIHPDRQGVEKAQQLLSKWLQKMGLAFKPSKTRICHTLNPVDDQIGFNFLGFSIRQYRMSKYKSGRSMKGYKTIIQPSKAATKRHSQRLQAVVRSHKAAPQAALIDHLNPIIRGWSAYFSSECSKEAYSKLDFLLYQKLRAWAYRRHPHKSGYWRASRYWLVNQGIRMGLC